ncbi:MAG TPA: SpoIVB peptidase S55 domain-containing protein [Spirochaetota bacterium]|nr:SpoIVB peptidase S55 domain-containing protein [Spirochaetota bacterium]HPN82303.1 SpoIVB peptidase S55 domain-containing protein [Spirochaetota bacterium]
MRLVYLSLVCLLMAQTIASAAPPEPGVPVLAAADVKKGMKGYGLTVFEGTTITRFDVEIIGVLYNTGAKSDLILARLSGGPLAETGVIAGMSGSPVYIDGKLIGAVAYAWGFSKSTIAGITPIGEMLDVFTYDGRGKTPPFRIQPSTNTTINGQTVASTSASLRRVVTPLVVSGVRSDLFPRLSKSLEKHGFLPVLGGSAGTGIESVSSNLALAPGSAIGVQLVSGDISMTGIGTVTWVSKDQTAVLAFGHPMMLRGDASFPMTTAWIHTVMPSLSVSFKLGSALRTVGSIHQDRAPAIGGKNGVVADTVPVSLSFTMGERSRDYRFSIIRDQLLFPELFASTIQSVLLDNSAKDGMVTYGLEYGFVLRDVKTGRRETIQLKDAYASFQNADAWYNSLYTMIVPVINALFSHSTEVVLESITIGMRATPGIAAVQISGLSVDRKKVRPGDTVTLTVELTPWRGTPFTERLQIKVPENTVNGRIFFVVSSTAEERYWDRFFGSAKYDHYSFDGLIRSLRVGHDPSELAVWSELYQTGLVIGDEKLPNLPDSQFMMLANANIPRSGFMNGRLRSIHPTTHFLYGIQLVMLDMDYEN